MQALTPDVAKELQAQGEWVAKHSRAKRTGQPRLPLTTVDVKALAHAGLDITEPTRSAAVTQDPAKEAAEHVAGPGRILEVRLANCYWETVRPPIDHTCWVVSKEPVGMTSHGPPGSPRMEMRYMVVLIDARTGEFLKTIAWS